MASFATITRGLNTKSPSSLYSHIYGCDVYSLDSDPTNPDKYILALYGDDGNPSFSSKSGYSKILTIFPDVKYLARTGEKIDLTAFGYGIVSVDELIALPEYLERVFCELILNDEGILTGITKLLIYEFEA